MQRPPLVIHTHTHTHERTAKACVSNAPNSRENKSELYEQNRAIIASVLITPKSRFLLQLEVCNETAAKLTTVIQYSINRALMN